MPDVTTDHLRNLTDLVRQERANEVEWVVPGGVCHGRTILVVPPGEGPLQPGGALMVCEMTPAGTMFPPHIQEYCTEWLTCFCGLLEVTTWEDDGVTVRDCVRLSPGEGLRIEPGRLHQVEAIVESILTGQTIPKSKGYPPYDPSIPGGDAEADAAGPDAGVHGHGSPARDQTRGATNQNGS